MSLTPTQKRVLDFILEFKNQNGVAPSQSEIAKEFQYRSLGTVQNILKYLKQGGWIESKPNARRGLEVKPVQPLSSSSIALPLLGKVAAGKPIEAVESQTQMDVPHFMVKRGEYFVLEVMGRSMIEEGILHGDFVIVKRQRHAENGQTVVALIDGAATVKKIYIKKNQIELRPANSEYKPILVGLDQSFQIEGIVSGVVRKFN